MKKQHQIKNQRCGNSQNLIFYLMLFFFRPFCLTFTAMRIPELL